MPLMPPGAAPSRVISGSTPSRRLAQRPTTRPVMTSVRVIRTAGFQRCCNCSSDAWVSPVPITVPIPICKAVRVPGGQAATSKRPLMLTTAAPISAPASGAAGMPVRRASSPIPVPASTYTSRVIKEGMAPAGSRSFSLKAERDATPKQVLRLGS